MVVAGVGGMRNVGSGNINLSGVSGTVTKAYLYWHGPTNSSDPNANASVTVTNPAGNQFPVTGTNIGFSNDNCWGFINSQAYRADVTSAVAAVGGGNGNYILSGFGASISNPGANTNGASLIVFFDDGNPSNNRDVVLFHGNDSNITNTFDANGWNVTLPGINYTSGAAEIQLHVADGQTLNDDALILNGNTLAPAGAIFQGDSVPSANNGPGNNGSLWDIKTYDVTSFLSPGSNTLTLTSGVADDCLALVVAAVVLPAGAAPAPPAVITTAASGLNFPFGVADGSVYIADRNNHKVWKIGTSPTDLILVAGTSEAGYNGDGILATTAQLNSPTGVAVANGNLFIADSGNHIIRMVSGGIISTVAGIPQKNGVAVNSTDGNPVIATEATLFGPRGVATDGAGNIYIADTMNQQVRKVDVITGTILAVAGVAGQTGNNDGTTASARLNSPLSVAVDANGNVYIADQGNDSIRIVDEGSVDTLETGPLNSPSGVAIDENGILYIADTDNHRIQSVLFGKGLTITTVAGTGTAGFSGDGGPATAAQLNTPVAVAVDSTGQFLYIVDLINNRVRKVDFGSF